MDRCADYNDRVNLWFYIDSEVSLIQRQVYNSFMLFGDVGGFLGLLIGVGSFIVNFTNFQNAENYVAQSLYKSPPEDKEEIGSNKTTSMDESKTDGRLDSTKQKSFIEYLQSILPKCCLCWCLRKKRRDRVF